MDDRGISTGDARPPSRSDVAAYLADMLSQFRAMALEAGYRPLDYLIDMARAEALEIADHQRARAAGKRRG